MHRAGQFRCAMVAWVGWLIAAGGLAVVELLTLAVVAGLLSAAAAVAAVVAALGGGVPVQVVAFAASGAALLGLVLPVAYRYQRRSTPALVHGAAALPGRRAVVVEQVDAHGGRVKIGGELWSARAYVSSQVMPPGAVVDVVTLDGVTALVYPKELP